MKMLLFSFSLGCGIVQDYAQVVEDVLVSFRWCDLCPSQEGWRFESFRCDVIKASCLLIASVGVLLYQVSISVPGELAFSRVFVVA